jgi:arylsulfatase A-like enzyme
VRRPNVLLVTLDQFRAECLGVAGHPVVRTPTLDRLATEGVRFTHHFSNCAPCAPGRASLLTGLWQMNHRVVDNGAPLADDLPMLSRELRALGYRPTLFGYTDTALDPRVLPAGDPRLTRWEEPMPGFELGVLLDEGIEPWLEWLRDAGYEIPGNPLDIYRPARVPIPADRGASWPPAVYDAQHTESAFITERALEWLDGLGPDPEPWCAHLSYLRPHPPYLAPAPYHDLYDPADVPPPVRRGTPEDEAALHPLLAGALAIVPSPRDDLDQRQLAATYYGMITEVDAALGRVIDDLERRDQLDDTVVVVTSDHGEQLGDHWLVEKLGFFDQSYRIPLIIRWPGMAGPPGRVVDAFTENVDVLPTLVDLCGGTPPEFCDGASLRPFLDHDRQGHDAPPGWRDAVHLEWDFRSPGSLVIEEVYGLRQDQCSLAVIRDHHAKFVQFGGDLPSLFFDLDDDPGELVDRAGDPSTAARQLDYARRLLRLRMSHTDPRLANRRAVSPGPVHRADPPRPAVASAPASAPASAGPA